MKHTILLILFFLSSIFSWAQEELYFPPLIGDDWEQMDSEILNWCPQQIDSLYELLDDNNTKAFIVLKDGKILIEKYFGSFEQDSSWYWASAAKTLTAFITGIAQEEGFLDINDPTSDYLGTSWTSCSPESEKKITIRHQLTMTSGLDDKVDDVYCTEPTCLNCIAEAGSRWAYHNAPYTLLDQVIENATSSSLNNYMTAKLKLKTGIKGAFFKIGFNNIYFSKARSMARFGLLILNKGNWNGNQIMEDSIFFNQMLSPSQEINQSYGYLWWLNGKASYMIPGTQYVFQGSLHPNAPEDMISAMGANGQILNIVPSLNLVVLRMGNAPEDGDIGIQLNDAIWKRINKLDCASTINDPKKAVGSPIIFPNPAQTKILVNWKNQRFATSIIDRNGKTVEHYYESIENLEFSIDKFVPGVYYLMVENHLGKIQIVPIVID